MTTAETIIDGLTEHIGKLDIEYQRGQAAIALLHKLEWAGFAHEWAPDILPACPSCDGIQPDPDASTVTGHKPGCGLKALLVVK